MPTVTTQPEIIDETLTAKVFTDTRIMEIMNFVIKNNIKGISDEASFLKSISYNNWRNLQLIKRGSQHFGIDHIQKCCSVYNVDANFLMIESFHKMFLKSEDETPMARLKIAVAEVDYYFKSQGK